MFTYRWAPQGQKLGVSRHQWIDAHVNGNVQNWHAEVDQYQ